jgi:hypothetical protein
MYLSFIGINNINANTKIQIGVINKIIIGAFVIKDIKKCDLKNTGIFTLSCNLVYNLPQISIK